ncbi:MAG: AraC family transcriptional regulator [Saprospiraceae bacterium]|nr:AraC family transcriptional regulator [Saprospiraceae bacterium]
MPTCITIELLCLTLALYVTTYKEHQKFKSLLIENDATKVRLSKIGCRKLNLEGIRSMLETEIAYIKASSDIDQSLIAEYQDKVSGLNATLIKLHNLNIQKKQEESIKTSEFFERGRKIVHANLGDQSFKTESWAEAMFLSRSQFSNRWTQETGLAPSRYLLQCRVLKGKELLAAKSEKTIAAIAYECGFSDHAHFTRKFIEYFQLSPSEYRQSHSQSV